MGTDCDCFAEDAVLFTGRYGAWDKKKLTHDAFTDTQAMIKEIK